MYPTLLRALFGAASLGGVRLGMQVGYAGEPKETAHEIAGLERAGLDVAWVPEAYGFDSPSLMGYLAALTERVEIGAAILNVYSRTPTLLAMTAAGIDSLSGGRFTLGLGASGPQVIEGFHGVAYDRPVTRTREVVEVCRAVWRRERIEHDGAFMIPLPQERGTGLGKPLKLLTHPVRDRIPIYLASLGEKNVELTAEVAEGWLPIFFLPERADQVWGAPLAAGRARRDPSLPPLETVAGGIVSVQDDADTAAAVLDLARPTVALYVGGMGAKGRNFYNDLVCRYGYEAEAARIQDLYLAGEKHQAAEAVPADLLRLVNLVGPAGHIRERMAAFAEAGVTCLSFTPVADDKVALVERLRAWADDA